YSPMSNSCYCPLPLFCYLFFFFKDPHTTEIYTLSLHDALPILDEWMELDKRTPSDIQPLFAQLLKNTFFNSGRIAVKIASVWHQDRKSTRLNSSHLGISYAVFCLKKKKKKITLKYSKKKTTIGS